MKKPTKRQSDPRSDIDAFDGAKAAQPARKPDAEADCLARVLISQFASALRDLAGGSEIPKEWREALNAAFSKPRGKPRNPDIEARDKEIAHRMLLRDMAEEAGRAPMSRTSFALKLAGEYDLEDSSQILKIAAKYEKDAFAIEMGHRIQERWDRETERKAELERSVQARLDTGESWEAILGDTSLSADDFMLMRRLQLGQLSEVDRAATFSDFADRKAAIRQWIARGDLLRIDRDSVQQAVNAARNAR